MPFRQSGNESDVRIRPGGKVIISGEHIADAADGSCDDQGAQTDIAGPPTGATVNLSQLLVRYDWRTLVDCCPHGVDLKCIQRMLVSLVSNHFLRPETIEEPELKQYLFTNDPSTTKLRVDINSTFNLSGAERFPAIVIKRLPTQSQRIVMGDLAEPQAECEGSAYTSFVRMYTGGHRLIALSRNAAETELFGQELLNLLTDASPWIRTLLPFHDFQVTGLGELGILDEVGNLFAVPIDISYVYQTTWTINEPSPTAYSPSVTTTISQS